VSIDPSYYCYESPLSILYLTFADKKLLKLEYEPEQKQLFQKELPGGDIKNWLNAYFSGQPLQYPPALYLQGTVFQKKVWNIMLEIP